jgi:acylphosphatase
VTDIRRRVVVSGRVQGVYYRDSCQQMAGRLKVRGSVRNRDDGAVEAVFEGDADAVDMMIEWCRAGPRHALVTGVRVTEEEPTGERSFRVEGDW